MPNWCSNRLVIGARGDAAGRAELAELWARLEPNVVSGSENVWDDKLNLLRTLVPMPEEYEGTVEGSDRKTAPDGKTWYEWQRENWGVKWGDCEGRVVEHTEDRLVLDFMTPWAPPEAGLRRISDKFSHLAFVLGWHEDGMQDSGQLWLPHDVDPDEVDHQALTLAETTTVDEEDGEEYSFSAFPELRGSTGYGSG